MKMLEAKEEWHSRRKGEEYGERMSEELFQSLLRQMKADGRRADCIGGEGPQVPGDPQEKVAEGVCRRPLGSILKKLKKEKLGR